ncbi:MAG: hypothetical protein V4439_02725 [Patescibacteria group bacterium]
MNKNLQNISIEESNNFSTFLGYIRIVIQEKLYPWILYALFIKIFGGKDSRLVVIKNNKKVIGGFFITTLPLNRYKISNWFRKDFQNLISSLIKKEYKYFCCFIIKESFRNKGLGTMVFDTYLKKRNEKLWFISSPKARTFYIRNGATLVKYEIYIFN